MKISVLTPTIRPQGLHRVQESLRKQTFKDFEWLVEVGLGVEHDLNKAYNKMIRRANGELIVFLQDYTSIPDDGLEKFWNFYVENKNTFTTAPLGKTIDGNEIKWDWRKYKNEIDFQGWEIDWGACPKSALFDIGGFNEDLDKFWSFDNVDVAYRAKMLGYNFACIDNPAIAIDHDAIEKHPFRHKYNPQNNNQSLRNIESGNFKKWI